PTPPPPTATLFPYTTLFRSLGNFSVRFCQRLLASAVQKMLGNVGKRIERAAGPFARDPRNAPQSFHDTLAPLRVLRKHHRYAVQDRKSTRLNSSHDQISYAV